MLRNIHIQLHCKAKNSQGFTSIVSLVIMVLTFKNMMYVYIF